ncbi:MAG: cytochrome c oxidase assembly protein [Terriglobales bacterium]
MSAWQLFSSGWDWEPSVVAGCALLLLSYLAALRFRFPARALSFAAGVSVLLLALVSPIDTLGDAYLFSAHMVQHILLILVVPPLLIIGIPRELSDRLMRHSLPLRTERILSKPLLAWTLGVGTMWIWHWPPLYNATLSHEGIHIAEHLMFLITATIFWWPVIGPVERSHLSPLAAVIYLFSACAAHTVLAILITFAPVGTYPAYLQPSDTLDILPLLRKQWGLTPGVDQQLGGLLMWVPVCLIYLGFIVATMIRWYSVPNTDRNTSPALNLITTTAME